jgi:hypothetical protein
MYYQVLLLPIEGATFVAFYHGRSEGGALYRQQ